ncbi:hypothetical protein K470DRAFT_201442, partial [Piedraia hortae CBS 480.64]
MDLLKTVEKSGSSRGGVNFSWEDVKKSEFRENYLGHSIMAPVGRWQKGKDLNWYAKADDAGLSPEEKRQKEEQRRREELRKVKEAEEDAMAAALGLPPPDRSEKLPMAMSIGSSAGPARPEDGAPSTSGDGPSKRRRASRSRSANRRRREESFSPQRKRSRRHDMRSHGHSDYHTRSRSISRDRRRKLEGRRGERRHR